MARLKEDGEFQVEGTVTMWLPLDAEEGERFAVNSSRDVWPQQVWLSVSQENGNWVVGTVSMKGRIYRKDNTVGERWDEKMFSGPHDDGEFEGPDWLIDLINREVPRRLGLTPKPEPLSSVEISRRVRADHPRERFNSALKVLLMRENLSGTQWCIGQVLKAADDCPDNTIADYIRAVGARLSDGLDKRAAALAATED